MTGWQRFDDIPNASGFNIYWAWSDVEPRAVPWLVNLAAGINVHRPATHWHAAVAPEPPSL